MVFICYPKCSTCAKARKWLDDNVETYEERDIKTENPSYSELKEWQERSGLPARRFFNTSGRLYRELGLKEKLPTMPEDEQLALLAQHGMLVRRPLLVTDSFVLVGFREAEWSAALL